MRFFAKKILINYLILNLLLNFYPGMIFTEGLKGLVVTALILSVINFLIKPILKIILIPFNLLTFGLSSWFLNFFSLIILVLVSPYATVTNFEIHKLDFWILHLTNFHINIILSIFLASLIIYFLEKFFTWITD